MGGMEGYPVPDFEGNAALCGGYSACSPEAAAAAAAAAVVAGYPEVGAGGGMDSNFMSLLDPSSLPGFGGPGGMGFGGAMMGMGLPGAFVCTPERNRYTT
eukprot:scaffold293188_cov14-Tisochrysis_lutea.AAC.1